MSRLFKSKIKGALLVAAVAFSGNYYAQLGLKWSEMGPNDIAGRTRSIIIDNQDASGKTLYSAGVSGGVFKSTDAAATWMPVNDQSPTPMIGCMAQAPDGTIYLGTGETFGFGGRGDGYSGFLGSGLFKLVGTGMSLVKDSSTFGNINEVATDKTNAQRIYVASEKGFFVSNDGGSTFTAIATDTNIPVSAMDVKVTADGAVFFSVGYKYGTNSKVYKSLNGLTAYTDVTPSAANSDAISNAFTNCGRIELATAPNNSNVVYLSITKSTGGLNALYISIDKGTTWKIITLGTAQRDPFGNGTIGYGDYAQTIAVDPSNAGVLYIAGLQFYRWSQISPSAPGQGNWDLDFLLAAYTHDIKTIGSTMYMATDNGVFKSVTTSYSFPLVPYLNFVGSYVNFVSYSYGLNISQFNSVSYMKTPRNTSTTSIAVPVAGVAGGNSGNGVVYLPGHLNTVQTSMTYSLGLYTYQSDFSKILPNAFFISYSGGKVVRSNDINISAPSAFTDPQFKGYVSGAESNLPMRLYENYGNIPAVDFEIFYDVPLKATFVNIVNAQKTFTVPNVRPQASAKYDWIFLYERSVKKLNQPRLVTYTFTNMNTTATTFTLATTRSNATAKYDTLIISSTSNKCLSLAPPPQQFTIFATYTGSAVTSAISTNTSTPQAINLNTSLSDNIQFTFNSAPNDSSVIKVISLRNYYQTYTIQPVYTGTAISSYNISGEASPTASNSVVFLNNSLQDSVRFGFAVTPGDSSTHKTTVHLRYDAGSYIYINNGDISGQTIKDSILLATTLTTTSSPAYIKIPLKRSARLAVGVKGAVFAVKRPLNFSKSPDWTKIAGAKSRSDSPGGVATATDVITPVVGTAQRLEWSPDGKSIYFSTIDASTNSYYLYRISHIDYLNDSTDYNGFFSTDIDSAATYRKANGYRTTPLGKFNQPITGISVLNNNSGIMITCGSYSNAASRVYTSNGDVRTLNMNNTDATNFTAKDGTGLPKIPAYTCLFEMTDNRRALVGTEYGIYTTPDVTLASPVWTKEVGPVGNQLPNVPVFQIRQQTMPSWECYNNGIIYVATHGRGIWSTDKYAIPYAIGINELDKETATANSSIKLYPNPANENSNIWFNNNTDGTSYKVSVTDISGRVVMMQTTDKLQSGEQTLQLNTLSLTSGVYFVNVSGSNNFNSTSKLVIAK